MKKKIVLKAWMLKWPALNKLGDRVFSTRDQAREYIKEKRVHFAKAKRVKIVEV